MNWCCVWIGDVYVLNYVEYYWVVISGELILNMIEIRMIEMMKWVVDCYYYLELIIV